MSKKRILLDVTDFSSWSGHFTGIQRVIFEIGSRIAQNQDYEFVCFNYDEKTKRFAVVDSNIFDEISSQNASELHQDKSQKRVELAIVKGMVSNMPPVVKKALKRSYGVSRHYLGVAKNRAIDSSRRMYKRDEDGRIKTVEFKATDNVLILGAGWHRRTMCDQLAIHKDANGFQVNVLVHDAIPIVRPEFFGIGLPEVYSQFMFEVLTMASNVYAISESTKKDIVDFCKEYNIAEPKLTIVREGDSFTKQKHSVRPREISEISNYVLAVGSFEVRKNYQILYQAVKQAQLDNIDLPPIVIVGRNGWLANDLSFLIEQDLSVRNKLIHLKNVNDEELDWLYQHASFTVYPSIYEGWGLPIAESMFYGKFCIASNTSSMPEIAGDLVEYVSPYDAVGWMKKMNKYYTDSDLLKNKTHRVATEYRATDWSETASSILSTL